MCDPRDLGVAVTEDLSQGLQAYEPNLYLYDAYPGGVGQKLALFRLSPNCYRALPGTNRFVSLRVGLSRLCRTLR
ncbi:MAG: DUF1998 domain-containing protein [Bryobacteraceae bacterium]